MVFAAMMFFVGSMILVNPANLYVSPDETANAYVASTLFDSGVYPATADIDSSIQNQIHPRSTVSFDGQLLPGSFLGLPVLYGSIATMLGLWVLWILTPLLTIATALAWKQLVQRFTTPTVAMVSFVLFLLHPAVWYYSARGMMHNMLFVDLLVLSVWLWVCSPKRLGIWAPTFAGLSLGLALFARASEAPWILVGLLMSAVLWRRNLSGRRLQAGLLGLALGLALLLGMNQLTYGHPLTTGYTVGQAPPTIDLAAGDSLDAVELLPFGFHPMNAWRHFWAYGVGMFWWLSALSGLGMFVLLSRKKRRRDIRFMIALGALISLWLVFMYGSWEIHDNPDPTQITMANSYVRYWIPMYLVSVPMMAAGVLWLTRFGRTMLAQGLIAAVLLMATVGLNVRAVFVQGQDGLLTMRAQLERSSVIQTSVLDHVATNAVVIVDRADKLFFPHRRVMYPLRDEATYDAMPVVLESVSLNYYGITLPEQDMDYLNSSRLARMGLGIELIQTYDEESLYRIFVIQP